MNGHIEKRVGKSGSVSYRLTVSTGEKLSSGKYRRVRETISGTKTQAQTRLREVIHEIETGQYKSRKLAGTVGDLIESWLTDARTRSRLGGTPRPKTLEMYEWIANRYVAPHVGDLNLKTIRPVDIQQFHSSLSEITKDNGEPLAVKTIKHAQSVLSMALRYGVRLDLVHKNPAEAVAPVRRKQTEIETVSPEVATRVFERLEETTPLCAAASKLALSTGARRSEICALNWGDLDLDKGTIKITKAYVDTRQGPILDDTKTSKSRRNAAIAAPGVEALRAWRNLSKGYANLYGQKLDPADPLFMTPDGKRLQPQSLSRAWRRACERVGEKVTFHALRHSFATAALEAGVPITFVSNQLGHSSIAITADTYGHVADGFGFRAADAVGGKFAAALSGDAEGKLN